MNWFCWHDWSRWSDIKSDNKGVGYQVRVCSKCNAIKVRIV